MRKPACVLADYSAAPAFLTPHLDWQANRAVAKQRRMEPLTGERSNSERFLFEKALVVLLPEETLNSLFDELADWNQILETFEPDIFDEPAP
jgi:hypothetical protein